MSRYFRLVPNFLINSQKVVSVRAYNSSGSYMMKINYENHWRRLGGIINRRGQEVPLNGYQEASYTLRYDSVEGVKEDLRVLRSECLDAEILDEID